MMIKIGMVMPIYNRPDYLSITFENLKRTITPIDCEITFLMMDDCSDSEETLRLIYEFSMPEWKVFLDKTPHNMKTWGALRLGFDRLYNEGNDVLMNLDSDVKLKPYWLEKVYELHKQFPETVVSGFNTITNHPVIQERETYCMKKTIGGINMMFSNKYYLPFVRPALDDTAGWDWSVCAAFFNDDKKYPHVTRPSVIEHTGYHSSLGWAPPGDRSCDWVEEE
jgi:GT2 family glycosyltransferase